MPQKRHSATTAKQLAAVKGKPAKKAKPTPALADAEDNFFLDSDDENKNKDKTMDVQDQIDEEEAMETAEEKRLRLAKEYLTQLRANTEDDFDARRGVTGGSDEEGEDDENEDGATKATKDRLTALLQLDAAQAAGRVQRQLAQHVSVPEYDDVATAGRARRGHKLPATGLALSQDDTTAWTVSKDGTICSWDIETGKRTQLDRSGALASPDATTGSADWVKKAARATSRSSLLSCAVSSDGSLLAVGGGDRKVHVFDARAGGYVQSFPGHRDAITCLAFREGTHTLFSGSLDRTVKLWSLDDRAYMDTLFGHQAEVLSLDIGRAERAVTCAADRSCRVWKIPEESHLIFKPSAANSSQSMDCCKLVSGTEWVTGTCQGTLQLWSQMKRKPIAVVKDAHGPAAIAAGNAASAGSIDRGSAIAAVSKPPDVTGWIQSVAAIRGSDIVASGAGDGAIRLWQITNSKAGGMGGLAPIGSLPARGWVNGLAIARSARFVAAAIGQEPRMGRWARDDKAVNGLLLHQLNIHNTMA